MKINKVYSDLPPVQSNKSGWPWDQNDIGHPHITSQELTCQEQSILYPRISIVVPNYNYGHYLEITIRSILLQEYPNLELIVIDGGSSDNSIEVIKKYEKWISYWISEPDAGQSDAINKGLNHSTGDIFNWLNSDDLLAPCALHKVAKIFSEFDAEVVIGSCQLVQIAQHGSFEITHTGVPWTKPTLLNLWSMGLNGLRIGQPSVFLKTQIVKSVGGLKTELHGLMDTGLYMDVLSKNRNLNIQLSQEVFSQAIWHDSNKSLVLVHQIADDESHVIFNSIKGNLGLFEKAFIRWLLMQRTGQILIEDGLKVKKSTGKLISLAFAHPFLIFCRPFWGKFKDFFK